MKKELLNIFENVKRMKQQYERDCQEVVSFKPTLTKAMGEACNRAMKELSKNYEYNLLGNWLSETDNNAKIAEKTYEIWFLNSEEDWDVEYPNNSARNKEIFLPIKLAFEDLFEKIRKERDKLWETTHNKCCELEVASLQKQFDELEAKKTASYEAFKKAYTEMVSQIETNPDLKHLKGTLDFIRAGFSTTTGKDCPELTIIPKDTGDKLTLQIEFCYEETLTKTIEKEDMDTEGSWVISDVCELIEENLDNFKENFAKMLDSFKSMSYTIDNESVDGDRTYVSIPEEFDVGYEGFEGEVFDGEVTAGAEANITIVIEEEVK